MAGIVVELIISWLLLWFILHRHISVLGFTPAKSRILQFGAGLFIAASCCIVYNLLTTIFINNQWVLNKTITAKRIFDGTWWTFISVLYEELIFRGALLYIAIEKLGAKKACILSAVCFGIYHWFSFNVFGNAIAMIITFFMTGIFGLALAYAFAKTKSLYLPVALHLGWNVVTMIVFSNGVSDPQIFTKATESQLQGIGSLLVFLFQVFSVPILVFWYLSNKRLRP